MSQSSHRSDERGSSMMEFVLVLPFIFIITVLAVDFTSGLLAKQRSLVAIREAGLRHARLVSDPSGKCKKPEELISDVGTAVNQEILSLRSLSGKFEHFSPGLGAGGDDFSSMFPGGFGSGAVNNILGTLSKTQGYRLTIEDYTPPVATLLTEVDVQDKFVVDAYPWSYYEYPNGYLSFLGEMTGLDVIGDVFEELFGECK